MRIVQVLLAQLMCKFLSQHPSPSEIVPLRFFEANEVLVQVQNWSDNVQALPSELQDLILFGLDDLQLLSLIAMRGISQSKLRLHFLSRPYLSQSRFWMEDRSFSFNFDLIWNAGQVVEMREGYFRIQFGSIQKASLFHANIDDKTFLQLQSLKQIEIISDLTHPPVAQNGQRPGFQLSTLLKYAYLSTIQVLQLRMRLNAPEVDALQRIVSQASELKRLELWATGLSYPELQELALIIQHIRKSSHPARSHKVFIQGDTLLLGNDVF